MLNMAPSSSMGASSAGDMINMGMAARLSTSHTTYTAGRASRVTFSRRPYSSLNRAKSRSIRPASPCSLKPGLSIFEAIMGDRVSATMPEIMTAPGKGKGKFPEESAGKAALQPDGRIHCR